MSAIDTTLSKTCSQRSLGLLLFDTTVQRLKLLRHLNRLKCLQIISCFRFCFVKNCFLKQKILPKQLIPDSKACTLSNETIKFFLIFFSLCDRRLNENMVKMAINNIHVFFGDLFCDLRKKMKIIGSSNAMPQNEEFYECFLRVKLLKVVFF